MPTSGCYFARAAIVGVGVLFAFGANALAQSSDDEKAIRAAGVAYQDALTKGDGKALAALWTADGDIVDAHGAVMKAATRWPSPRPRHRAHKRRHSGSTTRACGS